MPVPERPDGGKERRSAVLIAGPTASGKSAFASAIGRKQPAVIINAHSMQVYRDLSILTSRPTLGEIDAVPHCLYGHVDASETYSVARWLREAEQAIGAAWAAQRLPVIIGGTGLYFRALERGLADIPPIPESIRLKWRSALREEGSVALHRILCERDPQTAASIRPSDSQRIVRALEVLDATGQGLGQWHGDHRGARLLDDRVCIVRLLLMPRRDQLYQAIDRRFVQMIETGALEEVRALSARGLTSSLPAMKAIGVAELTAVIEGHMSLDDAIARAQLRTRRYAKRQMTWFRNQMASWSAIERPDPSQTESLLQSLAL